MGGQTHNPHNVTTVRLVQVAAQELPSQHRLRNSDLEPILAGRFVVPRPPMALSDSDRPMDCSVALAIVPNALSLDTAGPMARSVYDIAVSLNVTAGIDPADEATRRIEGKLQKDYTEFLKRGSLKGARIGVLRSYMGQNPETDRIMEESIATLKKLGAVIVESVKLPDYVMSSVREISNVLHHSEFKASIREYLKTDTKPDIRSRWMISLP